MDDIVRQAIAKWPNVPDCYGWLGLDARGGWYLRDAQAQAAGAFAQGGAAKGDLLRHDKLLAFIGRNYACDARGCWFFQNGPQRVFVELEAAPWVWRVAPDFSLSAHTGTAARLERALMDDQGRVFALTDLGLGLVHSLDVVLVASAVEQAGWVLEEVKAADLPAAYGFVTSPQRLEQTSAAG
ncbi:DUF2946 family protein [Pseudorhodoferax soli]|uniref:DUF2946 family protein n=1 Tax=Pseudorhodoferax soli TaxID=545864 RepID=A0A368Y3I4_9BURK|nr:DUF2946 family protein [Pseudorhodoferax soli]RCW74665.1 DUF2946 family protein [Pseudorhodoferax soli]